MRNINHILQSIQNYKGLKNKVALAEFLGVVPATLSNWIKRETLDENLIISKIPEIKREYLRTGEGPMTEQGGVIQFLLKKIEILERKIEKLEKHDSV